MFSLASKLLSTVASPAFEKAYQKGLSIWEAKDDLKKLQETIETIKARLLDAEKKQDTSVAIKNLMKRVRDVLYDADDLFDEVATDEMLKQQISKEGKILKKVQASCSKLNPIVSRNSIANQVKDIRKRLDAIYSDMERFKFDIRELEEPITGARKGQDQGSFVDPKEVFGRDEDKKTILPMLLHDQSDDVFSVIAVVGIGGMGKTTFAQLVYNDEEVQKYFEEKWFACISDISDDREVIGKIFQSICKDSCGDVTLDQQQTEIRESIERKKFLLVLDDVWDDDHGRWIHRMSLFKGCAQGSKIIVTTRSSSVARSVGAMDAHTLKLDGLSEDAAWDLFRRVAFTPTQEASDSRWTDLGREIVKKCANVPLAIRTIGSLLYNKNTIREWESFRNEELAKLGESDQENSVMSVLKLSYDHLHSNLKHCFAYCSLFPEDYVFDKQDLIYLWMAQGYIKPNSKEETFEEVGHSYFMDLFRMSFFQEAEYDEFGEIKWCKMHDLIHDLAQRVAAGETITLTTSSTKIKGTPRHAYVGHTVGDSSANLTQLWNGNQLRSLFFSNEYTYRRLVPKQEFAKLKFLRVLKLSGLRTKYVPSSIGELKLLRYLDISDNDFKRLPDSITKLLNLCTLEVIWCNHLEALPNDLKKLVNLRHLKIGSCPLRYVPPGIKELTSLQELDCFYVDGAMGMGQRSKMADLFELKISGKLRVIFPEYGDDPVAYDVEWDGVECWQPLVNLQELIMRNYKGMRIPHLVNRSSADNPLLLFPNLTSLGLYWCNRVKCLPPFRHLPNLNFLFVYGMDELEYVEGEDEEDGVKQNLTAASHAFFLPYLKELELWRLPKLKGWSRKVEAAMTRKEDEVTAMGEEHYSSTSANACAQLPSFPSLSNLLITGCYELEYMPLSPSLRVLSFNGVDPKVIPSLLSIHDHSSHFTATSSTLERVNISRDELTSFPGQSLTSLRHLKFLCCNKMKRVELPPSHLNILEDLIIRHCYKLELWEEEERGVDWDSLPNLRKLNVNKIPSSERLPDCLRNLQSLGKLQISDTPS